MHGGAAESGAPKGNQNPLTHGKYTGEMLKQRRRIVQLMREARATLGKIE
jgi:uncharacterized protein YjcR